MDDPSLRAESNQGESSQFSLRLLFMIVAILAVLFALVKTCMMVYERGGVASLVLVLALMGVSTLLMLVMMFGYRRRPS